jgi:hypothetical protein
MLSALFLKFLLRFVRRNAFQDPFYRRFVVSRMWLNLEIFAMAKQGGAGRLRLEEQATAAGPGESVWLCWRSQ